MGQFKTKLSVEFLDGEKHPWKLTEPLIFRSNILGFDVCVPIGFCTDFASVPRLPIAFLLTGDVSHSAAVVHDYLYSIGSNKIASRKVCDDVFLEALEAEGVGYFTRKAMWFAVRMFGGGRFGR